MPGSLLSQYFSVMIINYFFTDSKVDSRTRILRLPMKSLKYLEYSCCIFLFKTNFIFHSYFILIITNTGWGFNGYFRNLIGWI